jgi:extracellular matrix regulatory protein A
VNNAGMLSEVNMKTSLINIGFGNAVVAERVIAVITPQSASGKRIREEAKENSLLIDATQGRKTRAIIIMDSNHIILSAMQPETLSHRLSSDNEAATPDA